MKDTGPNPSEKGSVNENVILMTVLALWLFAA